MRAWIWVSSLIGGLGLVGQLHAQSGGFEARVRTPAAEVRGGPSDIFPSTGRLQKGRPVHVVGEVGEKDGFWEITPPPGSSSWIADEALQRQPERGRPSDVMVLLDNAPVRLGSSTSSAPLPVERAKLARGTIVHSLGESTLVDGKKWWRIQPAPSEVRYVAKDALDQPQPKTKVSASVGNGAGAPVNGGRTVPILWSQAQQAEQYNDLYRAEMLYRQLYAEMAQPGGDHDLAARCSEQIDRLARRHGQPATWPARQQAPGVLVAGSARPMAPAAGAPAGTRGGDVNSGPGWLRRSGVVVDSRPVYVLEDDRGQVRYYLVGQGDLNLERFVNRLVAVFGTMNQRTDFAGGGYLSVYRLDLLR